MIGGIANTKSGSGGAAGTDLTRNPQVLHVTTGGSDTLGNGSATYPYASLTKAMAIIDAATAGTAWIIDVGPGAYTWEWTTANTSLIDEDLDNDRSGEFHCHGFEKFVSMIGEGGVSVAITIGAGVVRPSLDVEAIHGISFDITSATYSFAFGARYDLSLRMINCEVGGTANVKVGPLGSSLGSGRVVEGCTFTCETVQFVGDVVRHNSIVNNGVIADLTGEFSSNVVVIGSAYKGYFTVRRFANNYVTVGRVSILSTDTLYVGGNVIIESASSLVAARTFIIGGIVSGATTIEGNVISSSVNFAEPADGGLVAVVMRSDGAGDLVVRNNHIATKGIVVFDSHPIIDTTRNTADKKTTLIGNYFEVTRAATGGPADVNACVLRYARGTLYSEGNTYKMIGAASTQTSYEHAALFVDSSVSAGSSIVTSINDSFEVTLPAGTVTAATSTSGKSVICFRQGTTYTALAAVVVNPTIKADGNQNNVFAGLGSGKLTVRGTINSNVAVTFQNVPDGGYQEIRGMLSVSTGATFGAPGLTLDQNDDDQGFVAFEGSTPAGDMEGAATANVATFLGGDSGNSVGPWRASGGGGSGWVFVGMVRVKINGTDQWMPYYDVEATEP